MTREEFLRISALLGIALPVPSLFAGCRKSETNESCESASAAGEKVIIIGAGPAGLTAGYLLAQSGVDFVILEASDTVGGRTKTNNTFANFPISLGAEWLHVEEEIFSEIVNDPSVEVTMDMIAYDQQNDYALWNGQQLSLADIGLEVDQKFLNSSWFDFFQLYVVPSVASNILFNQVVTQIDYSSDRVEVFTNGTTHVGDKAILTVPVKLLQNGEISFTPELPEHKSSAIDNVTVWDGFKGFVEFETAFYPAFTVANVAPTVGEKLFYDAAYGQNTDQHILGAIAIGSPATDYGAMSDETWISNVLQELDGIFDGQATPNYVNHITQNWNTEPFAKGAYVHYFEPAATIQALQESVDNKLFFAGDAYTDGNDYSSVHAAARSAKAAVEELIG